MRRSTGFLALAVVAVVVVVWSRTGTTHRAPSELERASVEVLRKRYAKNTDVSWRGDHFVWCDAAGAEFELIGTTDDRDAIVYSTIGPIVLDYWMMFRPHELDVTGLIEQVGELRASTEPRLEFHPLTGPALVTHGVIATRSTTWRPVAKLPAANASIEQLSGLVQRLAKEANANWASFSQRAFRRILRRGLNGTDEARAEKHPSPDNVRRLIRHGWLRELLPRSELARSVERALADAARMRVAVERSCGEDRLLQLQNAFGRKAWMLRTRDETRLAVRPPKPEFGAHWFPRDAWLVLTLPPNHATSEAVSLASIRKAVLYECGHHLAEWTPDTGLVCFESKWRDWVTIDARLSRHFVLDGYLPPHIPLVDCFGDRLALITRHGVLRPPTRKEDAGVFVRRAADLLPDAAHLDLLGQYLFFYAYDSPESMQPRLLGLREICSDIHQASSSTLASVAGGVCRGDCDDLAELYVDVLRAQGRLAHVVGSRGHVAAMWAQLEDQPRVFVLQTGLAKEHRAKTLVGALRQAFRNQDDEWLFDPERLEVFVRFPGEDVRTATYQNYRVFEFETDAIRAAERARRRQQGLTDATISELQRGITYKRTPEKLLALARLQGDCRDYLQQVRFLKDASWRTTRATTRFRTDTRLAAALVSAGESGEARQVVERLLSVGRNTTQNENRIARMNACVRLCEQLTQVRAFELVGRTIEVAVLPDTFSLLRQMREAPVKPPRGARRGTIRHQLDTNVRALVDYLGRRQSRAKPWRVDLYRALSLWSQHHAFQQDDPEDDSLWDAAVVGWIQLGLSGSDALDRRLEACEFPSGPTLPSNERPLDRGQQLLRDLPWVKASPVFWGWRIDRLLDREFDSVDRTRVQRLRDALEAARVASERLDAYGPRAESHVLIGRVQCALLLDDADSLREALRRVARSRAKHRIDSAGSCFAACARFMTLASFQRQFAIWCEEVDYKPNYFAMAWATLRAGAPRCAEHIAAEAVRRYPEGDAFRAELDLLRSKAR